MARILFDETNALTPANDRDPFGVEFSTNPLPPSMLKDLARRARAVHSLRSDAAIDQWVEDMTFELPGHSGYVFRRAIQQREALKQNRPVRTKRIAAATSVATAKSKAFVAA